MYKKEELKSLYEKNKDSNAFRNLLIDKLKSLKNDKDYDQLNTEELIDMITSSEEQNEAVMMTKDQAVSSTDAVKALTDKGVDIEIKEGKLYISKEKIMEMVKSKEPIKNKISLKEFKERIHNKIKKAE